VDGRLAVSAEARVEPAVGVVPRDGELLARAVRVGGSRRDDLPVGLDRDGGRAPLVAKLVLTLPSPLKLESSEPSEVYRARTNLGPFPA
jgi:hypothetical protein